METNKCDICEKPSTKRCAKCYNVYYCSREHQVEAWRVHRKVCRPFKICINEEIGRHIIATKAIKEGDVVLEELPLIAIPERQTSFVCMGCLKYTDAVYPCQKCGWSVCSKGCQNNAMHKPECYYFAEAGKNAYSMRIRYNEMTFLAILVLRCLYQQKFNPEVWKKLQDLESHSNSAITVIAETVRAYKIKAEIITKMLVDDFGLKHEFSEEEIGSIVRMADINSFSAETDHSTLHEIASLFEHDCKANCRKVFNSERMMRITAATAINKGDHLSITYTSPIRTTFERQERLRKTKFFTCQCKRCVDVTEFGTYFSGLKCQTKLCHGILLPETFLVPKLDWTCNKCNFRMTSDAADSIYKCANRAFEMAQRTGDYNTFLESQSDILTPNHSFNVQAKIKILFSIGNIFDMEMISNTLLSKKITLCREVLEFLGNLAPAEKGMRGDILYHLSMSLSEMCRRKNACRTLNPTEELTILQECRSLMNEVVQISAFKYDEENQYEWAKGELKNIEGKLSKLKI